MNIYKYNIYTINKLNKLNIRELKTKIKNEKSKSK